MKIIPQDTHPSQWSICENCEAECTEIFPASRGVFSFYVRWADEYGKRNLCHGSKVTVLDQSKVGCLIVIHEAADNLVTFVAVFIGVFRSIRLKKGVSLH